MRYENWTRVEAWLPDEWMDDLHTRSVKDELTPAEFIRYTIGWKLGWKTAGDNPKRPIEGEPEPQGAILRTPDEHLEDEAFQAGYNDAYAEGYQNGLLEGRALEQEVQAAKITLEASPQLEGLSQRAAQRIAEHIEKQVFVDNPPVTPLNMAATSAMDPAAAQLLFGEDVTETRFPQVPIHTQPITTDAVADVDARNEGEVGVGTPVEAEAPWGAGMDEVQEPTNQPSTYLDCPHQGWMTRMQPNGTFLCRSCGAYLQPQDVG